MGPVSVYISKCENVSHVKFDFLWPSEPDARAELLALQKSIEVFHGY